MPNPFSFITDMLGLTQPEPPPSWDPVVTQGEGPPTLAPGSTRMGAGYQPPRAAHNSGWIGLFDKIMGTPTADQIAYGEEERKYHRNKAEAQKDSQAMGEIFQAAAKLKEASPDLQPHQLFKQIIQDQAFTRNIGRINPEKYGKIIQDLSTSFSEPVKEVTTAPGAVTTAVGTTSGKPVPGSEIRNPTAEVQGMQALIAMSPADRALITAEKAKTPTEKGAAIDEMERQGMITSELALKLKAGVLHISAVADNQGNIDRVIVDKSALDPTTGQPKVIQALPRVNPPAAGQPPAPGQPQPDLDPAEPAGTRLKALPKKSEMFLGTGMVGWGAAGMGGVAGNVDSALAQEQIHTQRNAMRQYRFQLGRLMHADDGRTLKKEWEAVAELFPDLGPTSNPILEVGKGIQMRELLEGERTVQDRIIADRQNTSPKDRVTASKQRLLIDGVLRSMPTIPEMQEMAEDIRAGRAGTAASQLLKSIPNQQQLKKGAGLEGDPAANEFSKMSDKEFLAIPVSILSPEQVAAYKAEMARRRAAQEKKAK